MHVDHFCPRDLTYRVVKGVRRGEELETRPTGMVHAAVPMAVPRDMGKGERRRRIANRYKRLCQDTTQDLFVRHEERPDPFQGHAKHSSQTTWNKYHGVTLELVDGEYFLASPPRKLKPQVTVRGHQSALLIRLFAAQIPQSSARACTPTSNLESYQFVGITLADPPEGIPGRDAELRAQKVVKPVGVFGRRGEMA